MERVATSVLTRSEDVDVSFRLIQSVLTDALGMERVSAKFVSVMLPADQKQAARHLLVCVEKDENISFQTIITFDEFCVYRKDPKIKAQSWK